MRPIWLCWRYPRSICATFSAHLARRARAFGGLRQGRGAGHIAPAAGDRRGTAPGGRRPPCSPDPTSPTRSPPDCRPPPWSPPPMPALRETVAALLGTPSFRLYGNDDPIGAQVGGAAKNVDRDRGRRGDRRRPRRERPCRTDHARTGRAGAARRGARRTRGDGDGAVGARRSAADLHRRGQPQLQPRAGAGSWRAARGRAGGPQLGDRGRGHGARPGGTRPRGGPAGLRRGRHRCWQGAPRWPRRSPPCLARPRRDE